MACCSERSCSWGVAVIAAAFKPLYIPENKGNQQWRVAVSAVAAGVLPSSLQLSYRSIFQIMRGTSNGVFQ